MIATEVEAKTKWCPMVRHTEDGNCIGSGCMMWRWGITRETSIYPPGPSILPPMELLGKELPKEAWQGYCGLAGKP